MIREQEHPLVRLARETISSYLHKENWKDNTLELPHDLPPRAAVFVSLKKRGLLRGCIGTIEPTQPTLKEEVMCNAISSATSDPRFPPLSLEEIPELEISVDILGVPEPVLDLSQLDPKRYGVIVESGFRRGLLLPDLKGVDSVESQLEIARGKAGFSQTERVKVYRFEVKRYR